MVRGYSTLGSGLDPLPECVSLLKMLIVRGLCTCMSSGNLTTEKNSMLNLVEKKKERFEKSIQSNRYMVLSICYRTVTKRRLK